MRTRGLEFEARGELARGLTVIGNYSYIDNAYTRDNARELLYKTVNERIEYNPRDWSAVSEDALLLVKNMLAKNPEERLSIKEVLAFPWVKNAPPTVGNGVWGDV